MARGWTLETWIEHTERLETERQRALDLQAKEYERRLADLNHAHEQAEAKAHTYVTLDKYDDFVESNTAARDLSDQALAAKIETLENWKAKVSVLVALGAFLLPLVGAVIARAFAA